MSDGDFMLIESLKVHKMLIILKASTFFTDMSTLLIKNVSVRSLLTPPDYDE
jgi:hypothetical protein